MSKTFKKLINPAVFFLFSLLILSSLLIIDNNNKEAQAQTEVIGLVRQDCSGYANCFASLSQWEANYGGIDFGGCTEGDLVCADKIAIAKIDGAWTQVDIVTVVIDGWVTDATRYIRIYTTEEARYNGIWNDGKYRIEADHPIVIGELNTTIDGLQAKVIQDSLYDIGINIPTLSIKRFFKIQN